MNKPYVRCYRTIKLNLYCLGSLVLTSAAVAHSVHNHGSHDTPNVKTETSENSIDDLIRQYSLSGDDALLERGWALLDAANASEKPTVNEQLQRTWLLQAQHRFDEALEQTRQILAAQPRNPQAWLLRASIATVQGNYDIARHACRQTALSVALPVSLACSARLAQTKQEKLIAFNTLSRLPQTSLSAELAPWVWSIMADLARDSGLENEAEHWYQQSIAAFPSVQVRSAYVDLLLNQQRFDAVLRLIDQQEETPALAVRRLLAAKSAGLDIKSQYQRIDKLFRSWVAEQDYRHAREMALFYLRLGNDSQFAYQLAQENVKTQREAEDQALLIEAQNQLENSPS